VIAQQNGYFAKEHVAVQIKSVGTLAFTLPAAGKADLAITGATAAFSPAVDGHQTAIVRLDEAGPNAAGVVVAAGSRYKSLADLSGQTVSPTGVNGASWGSANTLSKYVSAHGGKPFKLVPISNYQSQVNEVISGRLAAAVGNLATYGSYVAEGKLRILVNPTTAQIGNIVGADTATLVEWGLASDLASKATAVQHYLAALTLAQKWIMAHSNDQVAAVLLKNSLFAGSSVKELSFTMQFDRDFMSRSHGGSISSSVWGQSLKVFGGWSLGLDMSATQLSYKSIVDMSYLNKATAGN
jgi:ABC-type nitrate/sulfonate/bicarbonate transport system substrate-binding protein